MCAELGRRTLLVLLTATVLVSLAAGMLLSSWVLAPVGDTEPSAYSAFPLEDSGPGSRWWLLSVTYSQQERWQAWVGQKFRPAPVVRESLAEVADGPPSDELNVRSHEHAEHAVWLTITGAGWNHDHSVTLETIRDRFVAETEGVRGPSAGLVLTLAALDRASGGVLAGDLQVAATGSISSSGKVGGIGSVNGKLSAAVAAGADVVFVPTENAAELPASTVVTQVPPSPMAHLGWLAAGARFASDATGSPAVVAVSGLADALWWLCGATGVHEACVLAGSAPGASPML